MKHQLLYKRRYALPLIYAGQPSSSQGTLNLKKTTIAAVVQSTVQQQLHCWTAGHQVMASSSFTSLSVMVLLCLAAAAVASAQLSPTFYSRSCPRALATIKAAVTAAVAQEARMGASLLRLHFHDCFVQASPSQVSLYSRLLKFDYTSNSTSTHQHAIRQLRIKLV